MQVAEPSIYKNIAAYASLFLPHISSYLQDAPYNTAIMTERLTSILKHITPGASGLSTMYVCP